MNNSSYKSVPVLATVIKSVTGKAVYLYNITSLDGDTVYKERWIPQSWNSQGQRMVLQAECHAQQLVEFPLSLKTQAMLIPKYHGNHGTIVNRVVSKKSQSYYQCLERYRIEIPLWLFLPKKDKDGKEIKDTGFVKKFTKVVHKNQTELFENDDNVIGVAEEIAMQSHVNEMFDYRPQADEFASDGSLEAVNDSLKQWYADNADYVTGVA